MFGSCGEHAAPAQFYLRLLSTQALLSVEVGDRLASTGVSRAGMESGGTSASGGLDDSPECRLFFFGKECFCLRTSCPLQTFQEDGAAG